MPKVTLTATLIKINRAISPGEWLLIHPDETYQVLSHEAAKTLHFTSGKSAPRIAPRPLPLKSPAPKSAPRPSPRRLQPLTITRSQSVTSKAPNGATIRIEPQKLAILQYMAEHGDLTVADASLLLSTQNTSILSSLKTLGFLSSQSTVPSSRNSPHIYTLTLEGRAIADAHSTLAPAP